MACPGLARNSASLEQAIKCSQTLPPSLHRGSGQRRTVLSCLTTTQVYIQYSIRDLEDDLLYTTRSEEGGSGQAFAFLVEKGVRVPRSWEIAIKGAMRMRMRCQVPHLLVGLAGPACTPFVFVRAQNHAAEAVLWPLVVLFHTSLAPPTAKARPLSPTSHQHYMSGCKQGKACPSSPPPYRPAAMTRGQRNVLQVKPGYGFRHPDCTMRPPLASLPTDQVRAWTGLACSVLR